MDEKAMSQADAALHWGIKDGFVNHVLDDLPDGRVVLAGGETARFRGSVTLTGAGALRVVVLEPWLTFTDDTVILSIRDPEAVEDDERMIVARRAFSARSRVAKLIRARRGPLLTLQAAGTGPVPRPQLTRSAGLNAFGPIAS